MPVFDATDDELAERISSGGSRFDFDKPGRHRSIRLRDESGGDGR